MDASSPEDVDLFIKKLDTALYDFVISLSVHKICLIINLCCVVYRWRHSPIVHSHVTRIGLTYLSSCFRFYLIDVISFIYLYLFVLLIRSLDLIE